MSGIADQERAFAGDLPVPRRWPSQAAELADMIAIRVVALIEHLAHGANPELATAAEVAQALGVGTSWVYANKRRLGAIRLGEGPKARLRFDLEQAKRAVRAEREQHRQASCQRRTARDCRLPEDVEMLQGRRYAAGG
jgi:hypothetical protein